MNFKPINTLVALAATLLVSGAWAQKAGDDILSAGLVSVNADLKVGALFE